MVRKDSADIVEGLIGSLEQAQLIMLYISEILPAGWFLRLGCESLERGPSKEEDRRRFKRYRRPDHHQTSTEEDPIKNLTRMHQEGLGGQPFIRDPCSRGLPPPNRRSLGGIGWLYGFNSQGFVFDEILAMGWK